MAAIALTPACGGSSSSSGGSGAGAVTSLDSSKTAGGLTDTEAKQYCEDIQSFNKNLLSDADRKKVTCGLTGQVFGGLSAKTDAEAKTKCSDQVTACLARPETTTSPDGGAPKDPCANAKDDLKDCSATLGEMNACVADNSAAFQALVGKDFCADAKATSADAGASAISSLFPQPASCAALQQKCPSLYKSTGGKDG